MFVLKRVYLLFQSIASAMPLLLPPVGIRTIETQSKVDFILKNSLEFNEDEEFNEVSVI